MKTPNHELDYESGKALQTLRSKIGLTQAALASYLGVSGRTVRAWEAGAHYPKVKYLKAFVALAVQSQTFPQGCEAKEIRLLWKTVCQGWLLDEDWLSLLLSGTATPERAEEALLHEGQCTPKIQNLPFPPNPFFTGRESELSLLSQLFEHNGRIPLTQPVSISGLGGIGKTALALEYAYRSQPRVYHSVLWVNAADKAALSASYLSLAHLLQLPERQEALVENIVKAVKRWLEEYSRWLLILDNADDLDLACSYLPNKPRGHILLTTRSQIVGGLAAGLCVDALTAQEALLFLLRRSGLLKPGSTPESIVAHTREQAEALVELLAGHPLALDQAGAYTEETGGKFEEYQQRDFFSDGVESSTVAATQADE